VQYIGWQNIVCNK